ncbi:MAG: Fpg/Nei family DNA glycosylase [Syntrophorhabdaceae bacterium]
MPELPDVEIFKQYLDSNGLHRKIKNVDVFSSGMLKGVTPEKILNTLKDNTFDASRRHGKHLFVHMESGDWLAMHFGMTGHLAFFKDQADEPPFDRLLVSFDDGSHLAYASQRKLGRIELIRDVNDFVRNHELGPDAMSRSMDFSAFKTSLWRARRSTIKAALMDQSIIAGIGNVYSDEILYQSNIHPSRKTSQLDENMMKKIFTKMKHVLRKAIDYKADPRRFPESWITPYRRSRRKFAGCIGPIESIKVSGRTAYFCPHSQKP